jgi:hypothetical protein
VGLAALGGQQRKRRQNECANASRDMHCEKSAHPQGIVHVPPHPMMASTQARAARFPDACDWLVSSPARFSFQGKIPSLFG